MFIFHFCCIISKCLLFASRWRNDHTSFIHQHKFDAIPLSINYNLFFSLSHNPIQNTTIAATVTPTLPYDLYAIINNIPTKKKYRAEETRFPETDSFLAGSVHHSLTSTKHTAPLPT